jgi:hypothetical protein
MEKKSQLEVPKIHENIHIGIAHDLTLYILGKEYLTN